MAKKAEGESRASKATGRFIPCAGNFIKVPSHGMPVFLELHRTAHKGGNLYARCGVCGHNGFWPQKAVEGAFTREEARKSCPPPGVGPSGQVYLGPVDGTGRPL